LITNDNHDLAVIESSPTKPITCGRDDKSTRRRFARSDN
jgi:hypothetical protein